MGNFVGHAVHADSVCVGESIAVRDGMHSMPYGT